MSLQARAKINLYLEILGKLPSGLHAVQTILHSIELADDVELELRRRGVSAECAGADIPTDDRNLACQAARLFFRFTGVSGGVHIRIMKRIPVGGGLGGGSADAAAVLVGLNALCETRYPKDVLARMGRSLGADVPFCVAGGCASGEGVGARLRPLPPLPRRPLLLINPGAQVHTGEAYAALNAPPLGSFNLPPFLERVNIRNGWLDDPFKTGAARNGFEASVFKRFPQIREARDRLRSFGAAALMSGTGGTVFGVFKTEAQRDGALKALQGFYPFAEASAFWPPRR